MEIERLESDEVVFFFLGGSGRVSVYLDVLVEVRFVD